METSNIYSIHDSKCKDNLKTVLLIVNTDFWLGCMYIRRKLKNFINIIFLCLQMHNYITYVTRSFIKCKGFLVPLPLYL